MKPAQGPQGSWRDRIPPERWTALWSVALLAILLAFVIMYQRYTGATPLRTETKTPSQMAVSPPQIETEETLVSTGASDGEGSKVASKTSAPTQLFRPLATGRRVLQPYAFTYSQAYGDFRLHAGIDFAAQPGESVLAAATGTVIGVEDHPADGMVVTLDHGGGMTTRYAGVGKISIRENATVEAGHVIAQVGPPGPARAGLGPHLHFEVRLDGEAVDPTPYFQD